MPPAAAERPRLAENSDPNRALFRTPPSSATGAAKKARNPAAQAAKKMPKAARSSPAPRASAGDALRKKKRNPRPALGEVASPPPPPPPVKDTARVIARVSSPATLGASEQRKCSESALDDSEERRKMRNMVLEEAMEGVPDPGEGRVMYLVRTFERMFSISKDESGDGAEEKKRVVNWALPGMQKQQLPPPRAEETEIPYSPEFSFTCSGSADRHSSSETANRGSSSGSESWRRSRRNSGGSLRRSWDRKLRVTSQQPFKLRTEQRGKVKEQHFLQKVKEMLEEEERMRIPVAQGLPWTTDEQECLMKPPTKESTEPIDLTLHTDVRAEERAEFDTQLAERISFLEQMRIERERRKKIEEEEEIKQLRKELVPRARPMPDFAQPFVPKRSKKPQTVPKEPRLRVAKLQNKR